MGNENKPLWLDLKKEYIDDNFERLVGYLQKSPTADAFYLTTLELLKSRVDQVVSEVKNRTLNEGEEELEERTFHVRVLALHLLVENDGQRALVPFLTLVNELMMLVPKFAEQLYGISLERLKYSDVTSYGFSWEEVKVFNAETFAYKFIHFHTFTQNLKQPLWMNLEGMACMDQRGLHLMAVTTEKAEQLLKTGAASLDICGTNVLTESGEKLKQSMSSDLMAINEFKKDFIEAIGRVAFQSASPVQLKHYSPKERALVRITNVSGQNIYAETIDKNYSPISGLVGASKNSFVYYSLSNFSLQLKKGDVIPVHISDRMNPRFFLDETFIEFLVEDFRENYLNETHTAVLIDVRGGQYVWLMDVGVPVYTPMDENYEKGDFANVRGTRISTGAYYGKIDGSIMDYAYEDEYFDSNQARKECIKDFLVEVPEEKVEEQKVMMEPEVMDLLIRQVFVLQHYIIKPVERLKLLCLTEIMATMRCDADAAAYAVFSADYLRALVRFVNDERMEDINLRMPSSCMQSKSALLKMSIIQLLKQWGENGSDEILTNTIRQFEESWPMLAKLARLIQTSNNMREIVTDASLNVLKREIIKLLSIETEENSDLEAEKGIYLGVESGNMEFKESIVYPPNNHMQPDEHTQFNNVMRGVCAFLNSTMGGTLYLGVNDQGYVRGIQHDMDYFNIGSIDQFMRVAIQDKAIEKFGLDVMTHIRLEAMFDEQVVAIHVEPFPYHVVELNGKAYIRINAESREMDDSSRAVLMERKIFSNRDRIESYNALHQAKKEKKQVLLVGYASSHGGEIKDRKLEAFDISLGHNLVMGYEVESSLNKAFNLNRIKCVKILDTPWRHQSKHKPMKVDGFHMTGEKAISCSLQLDLMAKNLLQEEYPMLKDHISKGKTPNEWFLNTEVYNMAGIGRFYIGLAGHIQILHAPELVEYIKAYKEKYLESLG